ncbi:MAG TPA: hypothetical protein VK653_14520, partial [Xanthobacteraceae bacterium]|nr:hypothetical protein [Xanthobacteraceae bacterium]
VTPYRIELIDENGGGPGGAARKRQQKKSGDLALGQNMPYLVRESGTLDAGNQALQRLQAPDVFPG